MFAAALTFLVLSIGISLIGFVVGSAGPADLGFVLSDVLVWSSFFAGVTLLIQRYLDYAFFSDESVFLSRAQKYFYTIIGILLILPVLTPTKQGWKLELGSYSLSLPYLHFTLEDLSAWVDQQWNALQVWLEEITVWLNQSNDFSIKNGLIVSSSVIGLIFIFLWISLLWSEFRGKNKTIHFLLNEVNVLSKTNLQQSHDLEVAEAQIKDLMSQKTAGLGLTSLDFSEDFSDLLREKRDALAEAELSPVGMPYGDDKLDIPRGTMIMPRGFLAKVREPGPEELRALDRLSPGFKRPEEISRSGEPKGWGDNIFEIRSPDENRSISRRPVHDPGVLGYGSYPLDMDHIHGALRGLRLDPETVDLLARIDREGMPEEDSEQDS